MSPQLDDIENFNGDANDNFLIFGLTKGHVIFVRMDMPDYIYARFAIHRQPVTQMTQIRRQQLIISICTEFNLKLWGFENNSCQIFQTFQMLRPIAHISVFNQNVLIIYPNAETLFLLSENKTLFMLPTDRENDHDDPVVCVDVSEHLGMQVTVDETGLIKVWNQMRMLVREIKFQEEVSSIAFINNHPDLVVGHGGKLSLIAQADYINSQDLVLHNEQLEEFNSQKQALTN